MKGKVYRKKFISRQHLRSNGNGIFLFGDNMREAGYGGQAAQMRGEPNAVGIPTKWAPDSREGSFFSDADLPKVRDYIDSKFLQIRLMQDKGFDIIIPEGGLGTGLAQLPKRAPEIHKYILEKIAELEKEESSDD